MSTLRRAINGQMAGSQAVDKLFPLKFSVDGNTHFIDKVVPEHLRRGMCVYDVGGGKRPSISIATKRELELEVVGVDIDAEQLSRAPAGEYDRTICADITSYRGEGDADLLICRALLEHVPDTQKAFQAIASILKPGGLALVFVPSRNAVFARLNLVLPNELKRKILYAVFPHTREAQGFKSYYDRCTPRDFRAFSKECGLEVESAHYFYHSAYFSFFVPAYVAWRLWSLGCYLVAGTQAAETFTLVLRKT